MLINLPVHPFSCRKKRFYLPVTSRPPIWQLVFWIFISPFATHETEYTSQRPIFKPQSRYIGESPCDFSIELRTCCFLHLPVVNKFLLFWLSQTHWNWLKLTETAWNWLKLIEKDQNRSQWMESRRESGGKPIEIAENWPRHSRMEAGAEKHLNSEPKICHE